MESKPVGIFSLPNELIRAILSSLSDAQSLHAASVTCKLLRQSFKESRNESDICHQVARNGFRPVHLFEALAEQESTRFERSEWTASETKRFFRKYVSGDEGYFAPISWDLQSLTQLERLHKCVMHFARELAAESIVRKNNESSNRVSEAISESEEVRFVRALYRFQIWCNIFADRKHHPFCDEEQGRDIIAQFAPWEMEQLACVYDLFMFKMMALMDVLTTTSEPWRKQRKVGDVLNGLDVIRADNFLARGLQKLYDALTASDEVRTSGKFLIEPEDLCGSSGDHMNIAFDHYGLHGRPVLADMTDEEEQAFVTAPAVMDEAGPEEVWRWSHQFEVPGTFVHYYNQAPLRRWAYVMWDVERLNSWKVFDQTWDEDSLEIYGEFYRDADVQSRMEREEEELLDLKSIRSE